MKLFLLFAFFLLPFVVLSEDRLVIGAEGTRGIKIVDPAAENKLLWHYPIGAVHDLHLLENGNILTQDGWKKVIELNLAKEVVFFYEAHADTEVEIHSFERLSNRGTMIVESGTSRILEVNAESGIEKTIALAVSKSNPHTDTRLARKLANGHYLVAHEGDQIVKEYDPDGLVVWEFPIPHFGKSPKKGHGPEGFGGRCFAAIQAANGNYLITTGNGHSILEVTPAKEVVWKLEQNDLPGITLAWVTTVEELENGNLRFGNCHAGPENPQIIEITRNKQVVWTYLDFENFGNALANTVVVEGSQATALRERIRNQ